MKLYPCPGILWNKSTVQNVFLTLLTHFLISSIVWNIKVFLASFPVAQMVEHGANNAKIMGSIPRESKSWWNVKL